MQVVFATAQDPGALQPRACDCSFCRGHGAAWVSDPAGALEVTEVVPGALREVRQGSASARFVLCADCGLLVCVLLDDADGVFAAVNASCLAEADRLRVAQPASPQTLPVSERRARWKALWVRQVRVVRTAA
ncbi:aldehyde-activating protein [Coralloluteibacterium stylophorae]|uniref:Aldehyde-activating protein n=1 Tax=Coralloluteibacterium stylophorae TaxID=1776034 RepID=A0A8J7VWR1_9GAMM|nr:aldehyde-activating protein [Coralloluteibacterium stylophorae]MBS7456248.1 aldehyde-activating protein [Coralloluteibacterium stylophorae]